MSNSDLRQRLTDQNFKALKSNQEWITQQVQEIRDHRWRFFRNGWVLCAISIRLHEQDRIIEEQERLARGEEPRWHPVVDPFLVWGMPSDLER